MYPTKPFSEPINNLQLTIPIKPNQPPHIWHSFLATTNTLVPPATPLKKKPPSRRRILRMHNQPASSSSSTRPLLRGGRGESMEGRRESRRPPSPPPRGRGFDWWGARRSGGAPSEGVAGAWCRRRRRVGVQPHAAVYGRPSKRAVRSLSLTELSRRLACVQRVLCSRGDCSRAAEIRQYSSSGVKCDCCRCRLVFGRLRCGDTGVCGVFFPRSTVTRRPARLRPTPRPREAPRHCHQVGWFSRWCVWRWLGRVSDAVWRFWCLENVEDLECDSSWVFVVNTICRGLNSRNVLTGGEIFRNFYVPKLLCLQSMVRLLLGLG